MLGKILNSSPRSFLALWLSAVIELQKYKLNTSSYLVPAKHHFTYSLGRVQMIRSSVRAGNSRWLMFSSEG
jgi:hypothetical protein